MDGEIAVDIFWESTESERIFEALQAIVKQSFLLGYSKGSEEKQTLL